MSPFVWNVYGQVVKQNLLCLICFSYNDLYLVNSQATFSDSLPLTLSYAPSYSVALVFSVNGVCVYVWCNVDLASMQLILGRKYCFDISHPNVYYLIHTIYVFQSNTSIII